MNTNLENLFAYIETLGWKFIVVMMAMLSCPQCSGAGEDFLFTVSANNLIEDVKDYAESFDSEEHAAMWYDAWTERCARCPVAP